MSRLGLVLTIALATSACSTGPSASRVPLSHDELVAVVPNAQMERVGQSGGIRRWTNNTDGTATIVRVPKPGAKAGSVGKAAGRWSISDDGKYCLDEAWTLEAGGPIQWCSQMYRDTTGVLHRLRDSD
jgi:hypothetical protein